MDDDKQGAQPPAVSIATLVLGMAFSNTISQMKWPGKGPA
jgi:hypothetical protein